MKLTALKYIRECNDITIERMSQSLGISSQSYINKEQYNTEFKQSEIERMCRILKLSYDDFFKLKYTMRKN
jgi:DNA-binding XRE family transcriptional regulator